MMMLKKSSLLIVLCILSFVSKADSFEIATDTTSTPIGGVKTIEIRYNGAANFQWPILKDSLTKDIEVLNRTAIDTIETKPFRIQQKITVTAWDSGYFVVPPIQLVRNQNDTLASQPILLKFGAPVINPNEGLKPIAKQWETPFIIDEIIHLIYWAIGITLFAIGLAILIIRWLIKRKKKQSASAPIAPAKPIIEILKEQLAKLESEQIWKQNKEKEFQFQITSILRSYLELEYNIKADKETSTNIIKQLNSLGINKELKNDIKMILNFSDMVKFAKQKGDYAQHEHALAQLKNMLNNYDKA